MSKDDEQQIISQLPRSISDSIGSKVPNPKSSERMQQLMNSTPARIGVWRTGTRPLTKEILKFRIDHAAAVDSVYGEISPQLLNKFPFINLVTKYENKENYLKRPDMGRVLSENSVEDLKKHGSVAPDVQIIVSDGLSANAIEKNLETIYPSLMDNLNSKGLSVGEPIFVLGGRVAIMDHIGEILKSNVVILLVGERPGLASSASMSAYMCYQPRKGTLESDRNVISNIHQAGTIPVEAASQITDLAMKMLEQQTSGVNLVI